MLKTKVDTTLKFSTGRDLNSMSMSFDCANASDPPDGREGLGITILQDEGGHAQGLFLKMHAWYKYLQRQRLFLLRWIFAPERTARGTAWHEILLESMNEHAHAFFTGRAGGLLHFGR